ncbi:hypothetical protein CALVIDRAFT_533849 [Calocera viscosa TUFC12733]|uniref:F-box domain-containing protein n=1 Tax=Calocera viscosa (strain TUFC12733) TaxID=1330018 RepID=A0A167QSX0_CALVF|nr:hypothetical protein CALVIDRAFT_533849 [Calocera viscosa TUFC12733]
MWADDSTAGLNKILDRVAACHNVQYLSLCCDDDMHKTITERLLSMLPHFQGLKRVDLWPNVDLDELLPSLSNLKYLETVTIDTPLMELDDVSESSRFSPAAFPALKCLTISNPFTNPSALLKRISSSAIKTFSTTVVDAFWIPQLTSIIISKGWCSSLEYLHLAFLPGEWYSIDDFAVCTRLRFLSVTGGRSALSETPLDMITQDFNMLEGLFLDIGPEDGAIKAHTRLELPINTFCQYVSRCPRLRYAHVPFSLDFPRGLALDADLVVPQLEYLFAESISCSEVPTAKAFISSTLLKLDRVLATGIDNKAQEVLDGLRITFQFPDAETLYYLRLNFSGEEPSMRNQIIHSLHRRDKKRYYRPRGFQLLPPQAIEDGTDDTVSDEQIVEILPVESPLVPDSPSSPQTLLSASDNPSLVTRSSSGDDTTSAHDLD